MWRRRKKKKQFGNAVSWNGRFFLKERNKNKMKTLRDEMCAERKRYVVAVARCEKSEEFIRFDFSFRVSVACPLTPLSFRFTGLSL